MTKICGWAADTKISPYADFSADPAVVERTMFSNLSIPSFGNAFVVLVKRPLHSSESP
jgi:hypothetical protein